MQELCDYVKGPTGIFTLEVFVRGELVERFCGNNLVVDVSKLTHSRLIGGAASHAVTQFGVGTNGSAPVAGNTGLTNAYKKSLSGVSYPDSSSVSFAFTLGTSEANGLSIMEFGLFSASNNLYARKVRTSPLVKTSDMSFAGNWTITF